MNDKVNIINVSIIMTERCNLACEHCARYEPDDDMSMYTHDITKETIDAFFENVGLIMVLNLSGGEPLLNIEMVEYIIDKIVAEDIDVCALDIITNGTILDERVVKMFAKIAPHIKKKRKKYNIENSKTAIVGLGVSGIYHNTDAQKAIDYYTEQFAGYEDINVLQTPHSPTEVLYAGRAKKMNNVSQQHVYTPRHRVKYVNGSENKAIECSIHLSTNGDIVMGNCSFYDHKKHSMGNVHEKALRQ